MDELIEKALQIQREGGGQMIVCPRCGSVNTLHVGCVFYTYSRECFDCHNVFPDPSLNDWGQHIEVGEDRSIRKDTTEGGFQR